MEHSGTRMSCILRLYPSPGWHKTLTKLLKKVKDVSYTIDTAQEFAYISGDIDTALLLKLIAKSGKHAELYQLDYGYKYNWSDYYSQKHQYYNQHFNLMPSLQQQSSSQDQSSAKSLQNSAAAKQSFPTSSSTAPTRPSKKKTNSNCCLM